MKKCHIYTHTQTNKIKQKTNKPENLESCSFCSLMEKSENFKSSSCLFCIFEWEARLLNTDELGGLLHKNKKEDKDIIYS